MSKEKSVAKARTSVPIARDKLHLDMLSIQCCCIFQHNRAVTVIQPVP